MKRKSVETRTRNERVLILRVLREGGVVWRSHHGAPRTAWLCPPGSGLVRRVRLTVLDELEREGILESQQEFHSDGMPGDITWHFVEARSSAQRSHAGERGHDGGGSVAPAGDEEMP